MPESARVPLHRSPTERENRDANRKKEEGDAGARGSPRQPVSADMELRDNRRADLTL
jgi:hypothetical protein